MINYSATFMKWVPPEPNNHGNGEDCGGLWLSKYDYGNWNDFNCANKIKTICEKGNNTFLLGMMNNIPNSVLIFNNISGILHSAGGLIENDLSDSICLAFIKSR